MARIAKSLVPPEQGYSHREHRSKKGRMKNYEYIRKMRNKLRLIHERQQFGRVNGRKGKWVA